MPLIIDTHCHLSSDYNNDELNSILNDASISGVKYIFDVGYDVESSIQLSNNILEYDHIYGLVGIHPDNCKDTTANDLKEIEELASSNNKIIGIGEIGLDYYHNIAQKSVQQNIFTKQLKIAQKLDLPVSIHVRDKKGVYDAYEDCFKILKQMNITNGVMHCFSGTYELAMKFIDLGFYISFSGIVTFKNSQDLQEIAKKIPLSRIVVETDAPYLAPHPYRGMKNYPKYIKYTVSKLATLKAIPIHEFIAKIHHNTLKIFKI